MHIIPSRTTQRHPRVMKSDEDKSKKTQIKSSSPEIFVVRIALLVYPSRSTACGSYRIRIPAYIYTNYYTSMSLRWRSYATFILYYKLQYFDTTHPHSQNILQDVGVNRKPKSYSTSQANTSYSHQTVTLITNVGVFIAGKFRVNCCFRSETVEVNDDGCYIDSYP
ncbi:hypothetical protein BC834DRAFT_411057 [Gloeopeniophorella convolvens]|nr:hypothetical protein BC834DRAFT_411057 [Gloeopeniophorella convolvens]